MKYRLKLFWKKKKQTKTYTVPKEQNTTKKITNNLKKKK